MSAAQDRAMDSHGTRALDGLAGPWSPWAAIQSRPVRIVLGFCAFELAYICAYHYGMSFDPVVAAPFWFPDAVLLCGLLCTRPKWWWLLLAAILPVRLLIAVPHDLQLWFLGAVYVNDCAKGVIAALLLRRFLVDPIRLQSMRDLGVYFLFAVLLVPALSALGGAATRAGMGQPFWPSFEQWLLGNALASLVVTPILFYWVLRPPNPATFSRPRIVEAALLAIGLLISLKIAFEPAPEPRDIAETRFYLPVPFMVWAAIRFRMFGATAVAAMLSVFAVDAALDGTGSFANTSSAEMSSHLQHFLLLRIAPLYLAAVLIEQWARVSNSLRESEQRFRQMADDAPVMIWMADTNGAWEFVNKGWLNFTGMSPEQFRGEGWRTLFHPDDLQRSVDNYVNHVQARKPFENQARLRRRDGEFRWVITRGSPRYDPNGEFIGFLGSTIDVTERRQQELALERSEARYRDVVESQIGFVCRFLPDATLTFVNSAYCRHIGKSREQLLGIKLFELFSPGAGLAAREGISSALSGGGRVEWECEVVNADGTRGWQHWACHAIGASAEEPRELQAVGHDITDRKRAEESGRQLVQATRFAAVGELTAMVAHEINQPLCAILSNAEAAELMLSGENPPLGEIREILADIRRDDLRADSAIRNIRSLLHRQEFRPCALRIDDVVVDVLKLVAGDALYRRVVLRRESDPSTPLVVGDTSQLKQVLVILIVNAMDAMKDTPEGLREVTVCVRRAHETWVEVEVRDRGHGIAAASKAQLFESFFTTKPDGMGLGLSIARSMITTHGGRIWAENAPDGGAAFRFTLAVAQIPAIA
jgi:PAS domain S-box-containing protein